MDRKCRPFEARNVSQLQHWDQVRSIVLGNSLAAVGTEVLAVVAVVGSNPEFFDFVGPKDFVGPNEETAELDMETVEPNEETVEPNEETAESHVETVGGAGPRPAVSGSAQSAESSVDAAVALGAWEAGPRKAELAVLGVSSAESAENHCC